LLKDIFSSRRITTYILKKVKDDTNYQLGSDDMVVVFKRMWWAGEAAWMKMRF